MKHLAILFLLLGMPVMAEEKAAAEAAKNDASVPQVLEARNEEMLNDCIGEERTVRGKIVEGKDWDGGKNPAKAMTFLNFEGKRFVCVVFKDAYDRFPEKPGKLYHGKNVEVTGKLEKFGNYVQIKLASPDQIKIIDGAAKSGGAESARANDAAKDPSKPPEQAPASEKAAAPATEVLACTDEETLNQLIGQERTVRGKVIEGKDWDGGLRKEKAMTFLIFEGERFNCIVFKDKYANFTDKPGKLYHGKTIEVTGKLEKYGNDVQIKLNGPNQVKIVETAPVEAKDKKDAKGAKPNAARRRF